MQCVLVSCCGVPASGKTTFCRGVVNSAASYTNRGAESETCPERPSTDVAMAITSRVRTSIRVSHVCFDEHIHLARRRLIAGSPVFVCEGDNHDRADRKREDHEEAGVEGAGRATCSKGKLDDDVRCEEGNVAFENGEDGAESWHEGRRCALAEVEALASATREIDSPLAYMTGLSGTGVPAGPSTKASLEENQKGSHGNTSLHVVLADDNMHYRSMRHDVLRLARKYGCGYAQIYFPTEVEIAIRRNAARTDPVPEVVIRKMTASIQPPDSKRYKWERYTATIESSTFPARSEGVTDSHVLYTPPIGDDLGCVVKAADFLMFWQTVAAAAEDPVPPMSTLRSDEQEQEEDRKVTKAGALHQLDLNLREAVKRVADKTGEASLTREAFRAVMGVCAATRRTVMRRARMVDKNDNDARKTAAEISGIQSDQVNGRCSPGQAWGQGAVRLATSSWSLLEVFASEFGQGIEVLEGLETSTKEVLVKTARGSGKLNQPEV